MAAIWADFPSGDHGLYGTDVSKMLDGVWAQVQAGIVDDPDPLIGSAGKVIYTNPNNPGNDIRKVLPSAQLTVGMSLRVWIPNIPTQLLTCPAPFTFRDALNNTLACVFITPTGALQVNKGTRSDTLVAITPGPVITANAWTHVSVKMTFGAGSTGSVSIEVEGIPVLTATGVDIGAGPCAQVSIYNRASGTGFVTEQYNKDIFIWDGTGSVNNDHPGPVTVYRRPVTADVSSGWTSTGATDFGVLDETPPDDADYISADDTLPAPSIMELLDLPDEVVSVRAICMVGRMKKTDGGDCKVQMSLSPNATDWADGSDRAITTASTYWFDWTELSPDTGFPWTPIEFNAAQIKINRTL